MEEFFCALLQKGWKPFRTPLFPLPHGPTSCSQSASQPVHLCTCLDLFSTQALYSVCNFSSQKHHLSLSHKPDSSNTFYKPIIPGEQTRKLPGKEHRQSSQRYHSFARCKLRHILSQPKLPTHLASAPRSQAASLHQSCRASFLGSRDMYAF